jgi:hypothetical protein
MYKHDYEWNLAHPEDIFSDKEHFSNIRNAVCFTIINRGGLWYDLLTPEERTDLLNWYLAWLDAWETKVVPITPTWL